LFQGINWIFMNILVVGYSVRHIACSAARAGHKVVAADGFCDLDLRDCAYDVAPFPKPLNRDQAERLIQSYVEIFSPDAVVLGPGLEEVRVKGILVFNNSEEKMALVSDKLWQARWLEERGFPFIPTYESTDNAEFPAVVKPRKGAGGVGCRLVRSAADLKLEEGTIIQNWLPGKPASVSVIGTGDESTAIAINEQLIGAAWAGAKEFRYSGNITPLDPSHPELCGLAEEVVSSLGLVGSNGVDFLLTEKGPVIVEINARFQGSLDTVELSTDMNVFQAHLKSFEGCLPERRKSRLTAGRAILFARKNVKILQDLRRARFGDRELIGDKDWITDVPNPKSEIKKNNPVASVLARGHNREEVLALLIARTATLNKIVKSQGKKAVKSNCRQITRT
jgi:predicted ATP-grasp superfamily ATP-dependent carboligase